MLQDETLRSFNFFIGAGSVKVSVCPEYPVLTSVFCSTARPSSTLSCSASWRGAAHGWPSSCISGSAPGSGSSLVPPVSPPTYTDNLQPFTQLVWADTTRTGEYNIIWKQGNLFLLLCPGCSWSHCRSPHGPGCQGVGGCLQLGGGRQHGEGGCLQPGHRLLRLRPRLRVRGGGRGAVRRNCGPHPSFPTMSP